MMRWAGYSALAQSHDLVVRRNTVMETLNLRTGEKVLELGCGGGSYAFEAARFVGPRSDQDLVESEQCSPI
jgi:ubiquinone/menaquinone biosynthesis C-methylase UbiE